METSYENLLKKAREELPESVFIKERFEIPKVKGFIQGNNTIVVNFVQIAKTLGREPEHLLKFVLKEIAAPGKLDGQRLIVGSKISASLINQKIKLYTDTYVLCPECGKPDTKLIKEKNVSSLKCAACGSKHPVRLI
ncbi:translation initiation factor IF-2 subunit beta [Candidatus Woesearchaeota archaeon]|nr:translation initiation factor IF-2 subunit beta [Candidatus Woesearchaeota archaeon]